MSPSKKEGVLREDPGSALQVGVGTGSLLTKAAADYVSIEEWLTGNYPSIYPHYTHTATLLRQPHTGGWGAREAGASAQRSMFSPLASGQVSAAASWTPQILVTAHPHNKKTLQVP